MILLSISIYHNHVIFMTNHVFLDLVHFMPLQASPAELLGCFAPLGFALGAHILGHFALSGFVLCILGRLAP